MNSFSAHQTSSSNADPYAAKRYRYYALGMLTVAYVFNFVDRQILAILQEPIKRDLDLTDTQLGLLTGLAFAIFYVVVGLPIARWADKGVRRDIIAMSVGLWSFATALCGMAHNFFQLLIARIAVGVGEAGCSPPAHSMISDIFKPGQRATALGVYNIGINIGILLGFLFGGLLSTYFGWRAAFFIVGVPGILLALVLRLTLAEPSRSYSDAPRLSENEQESIPSAREVVFRLLEFRTFRHMAAATGLLAFVGYGVLNWMPSFLIRTHGLDTLTIGTWLALIVGLGGGVGTITAGYLSDRLGRKDSRWYLWVSAISVSVSIPLIAFTFLSADPLLALSFYVIPGAVVSAYVAPVIAVTHGLIDSRMRALSSAIIFLILNLVGLGLGPLSVGLLSDIFTAQYGPESLRLALITLMPGAALWGLVHLLLASRHIRNDMQEAN